MKTLDIPVVAWGPGSQPSDADGAQLDYMAMPSAMAMYTPPVLPEAEEIAHLGGAQKTLSEVRDALASYRVGHAVCIGVDALSQAELSLVNQVLGEGEVSIMLGTPVAVRIQESVLTGVWRVRNFDAAGAVISDAIEICDVPPLVKMHAENAACETLQWREAPPAGTINAPSVLVEVQDRVRRYRAGEGMHVINLSLLPLSPEDAEYLERALGAGSVAIRSRGYGSCHIRSTQLKHTWWVRYYNSQDVLILNTLEIGAVPEVARAAMQDIEDSAVRLSEIIQWVSGDVCGT